MLSNFVLVILFGVFYVVCKRDAELSNTRKDGFWHGWYAALLLYECVSLLGKLATTAGQ